MKYKKAYAQMLEENESLFSEFKTIHDNFANDSIKFEQAFHELGTKVLRVIRRYENSLCARSENSGFSRYSANLSEKFWNEVRCNFPHIDQVKII